MSTRKLREFAPMSISDMSREFEPAAVRKKKRSSWEILCESPACHFLTCMWIFGACEGCNPGKCGQCCEG